MSMGETVYTSVRRVSDNFSFEQYTGNDESLNRLIYIADTNRPGLELTGYFDKTQLKRIVLKVNNNNFNLKINFINLS